MIRSTIPTASLARARAFAIILLAVALVSVTLVPASADLVDRLEPIDDVTPGQRSAHQVCADDTGSSCVNATLETSPFACDGGNLTAFHCNVTYYLNLTLTAPDTCGNASVNVSEELSVDACTGLMPATRASSGPVTVSYNGTNTSRVVNATAWACLDVEGGEECQRWQHDPVLLPSWREWQPRVEDTAYGTNTDHLICLGSSAEVFDRNDPGPGCALFWVVTYEECTKGNGWDCDLYTYTGVSVDGMRVCGSLQRTTNETATANETQARACTLQSEGGYSFVFSNVTRYEDVPREGKTLAIDVEACAYVFAYGAERYCETFRHLHFLEAPPCDHFSWFACLQNSLDSRVHRVDGPPSVYP